VRNKHSFLVALAALGLLAQGLFGQDLFAQGPAPGTTVTINVVGVKTSVGTVIAAICEEKQFLASPCTYSKTAPAQPGGVTFVFNNVAPGRYAVAAFQDLDGDGDLKITFTGPGEPAGVSGPKTFFPNFGKANFDVGTEPRTIDVILR
jgi:uncharacterized protein (DUF2141 family)